MTAMELFEFSSNIGLRQTFGRPLIEAVNLAEL